MKTLKKTNWIAQLKGLFEKGRKKEVSLQKQIKRKICKCADRCIVFYVFMDICVNNDREMMNKIDCLYWKLFRNSNQKQVQDSCFREV